MRKVSQLSRRVAGLRVELREAYRDGMGFETHDPRHLDDLIQEELDGVFRIYSRLEMAKVLDVPVVTDAEEDDAELEE